SAGAGHRIEAHSLELVDRAVGRLHKRTTVLPHASKHPVARSVLGPTRARCILPHRAERALRLEAVELGRVGVVLARKRNVVLQPRAVFAEAETEEQISAEAERCDTSDSALVVIAGDGRHELVAQ